MHSTEKFLRTEYGSPLFKCNTGRKKFKRPILGWQRKGGTYKLFKMMCNLYDACMTYSQCTLNSWPNEIQARKLSSFCRKPHTITWEFLLPDFFQVAFSNWSMVWSFPTDRWLEVSQCKLQVTSCTPNVYLHLKTNILGFIRHIKGYNLLSKKFKSNWRFPRPTFDFKGRHRNFWLSSWEFLLLSRGTLIKELRVILPLNKI
jgi:hypothetical protein